MSQTAKKIRLLVFPGYFVPHIGGLEAHVDEFVKFLSKDRNYIITIFAPNLPGSRELELIHNGVKVIRYPAFEILGNYPVPKFWKIRFWRLMWSLYQSRYDIVMTRTRFFTNTLLGLVFAKFRLTPVKLVHVEHGSSFVRANSKLVSFLAYLYDQTLGRLLFCLSDENIAVSLAVQKFICDNFLVCNQRRPPIIRRGLDFDFCRAIPADKDLRERFSKKIIACFVGRLSYWKGVENSVRAYKALPRGIQKRLVFLVVGGGQKRQDLEKLSAAYLKKGIYFLGEKSFSEAISVLKAADIYLHSSYPGGGLSSSLLQAMFCACAVAAGPYEGADEVIADGDNGLLLRDNTPDQLKTGLIKLVEAKDLREKLGRAARRYAEKNFSWETAVAEYDKVFTQVLAN